MNAPEEPLPAQWRLHVDVLEAVSGALLTLALWTGIALLVAAFVAQATGGWVFLLAPVVGVAGAGLSVRSRALQLWQRGRSATERGDPAGEA